MLYRESGRTDPSLLDERHHNIVLRQRPALGPWLVTSLGIVLVLFLAYLLYSNMLVPPVAMPSPERSLRVIAATAVTAGVPPPASANRSHASQPGPAITVIPHSRATNALLGGQGPAALPGHGETTPLGATDMHTSAVVTPR